MRIPLRHVLSLVSEQPLNLVEINPALHEPRRERMAQIMESKIWNARAIASLTRIRGPRTAP